jgi:hypothetical protein
VTWEPPYNDGGSPIRSYKVTVVPGHSSCTTALTSCTVGHLENGHRYRVEVSDATTLRRSSTTVGPLALVGTAPQSPTRPHLAFDGNQLVVTWRRGRTPSGEPQHFTVRVRGPKGFRATVVSHSDRASITIEWTGLYSVWITAANVSGRANPVVLQGEPVDPISVPALRS